MEQIPRDTRLDSIYALWKQGYRFITNDCQRHHSDLFQTRLLFEDTICMQGRAAAQLFYDTERFSRIGATPVRIQKTLFGQQGVQGLDGVEHRHRKAMFLSLMSAESIDRLVQLTADRWSAAVPKWRQADPLRLFPAVQEVLCRAVCTWSEVPLPESDVARRTRDMAAMIDTAAAVGPRYWRGKLARRRSEAWAAGLIEAVRSGRLSPAEHSALHIVSRHRGLDGKPLDAPVAAVELINVLRPVVALGYYVIFSALALHQHPRYVERLRDGEADFAEWFVQEVRRLYPFFPFVGARVREDFTWEGLPFPRGRRVLLDLYGTNHDARLWEQPEAFRPERFRDWAGDAYTLIPQGGGDHGIDHRCPGEWITIALLKRIVRLLAREMRYEVPPQDLSIDLSEIPTLPNSQFLIRNVQWVP